MKFRHIVACALVVAGFQVHAAETPRALIANQAKPVAPSNTPRAVLIFSEEDRVRIQNFYASPTGTSVDSKAVSLKPKGPIPKREVDSQATGSPTSDADNKSVSLKPKGPIPKKDAILTAAQWSAREAVPASLTQAMPARGTGVATIKLDDSVLLVQESSRKVLDVFTVTR